MVTHIFFEFPFHLQVLFKMLKVSFLSLSVIFVCFEIKYKRDSGTRERRTKDGATKWWLETDP